MTKDPATSRERELQPPKKKKKIPEKSPLASSSVKGKTHKKKKQRENEDILTCQDHSISDRKLSRRLFSR
jgi:hypothetical protein